MSNAEFCGSCGAAVSTGDVYCGVCGSATAVTETTRVLPRPAPSSSVVAARPAEEQPASRGRLGYPYVRAGERHYGSLRAIAGVFIALGWLVIVAGAVGAYLYAEQRESTGSEPLAAILIGGAVYIAFAALWMFAFAAFIRLMLDLEENTRRTADLLAEQ